jgi:agmatine deiminase
MATGRGLRVVLGLELALAVLPVTIHYLCLFPIGLYWTARVARIASRGVVNPFTVSMAGAFLLGGIGLASLWIATTRRLLGRESSGRLHRWGLLLGVIVSSWLLFVMATIGGEFLDYYLYGAPLIAAAHHLYLGRRRRAPSVAPAMVVLAMVLAPVRSSVAAERPRVPAEWEPALGAMVAWPPIVPESLLVEIARDDRLYLLVEDSTGQADAERALARLRIDPAKVQFIVAPAGDARSWPRDWGPFPLFDEEGTFRLVRHRFVDYPGATANCDGWLYGERTLYFMDFRPDDAATTLVAEALGLPMTSLSFALTGGNALVDGHGTAFSTCIMLNENRRSFRMGEDEFYRAVETRLGITRYVIVPNFEWFGIQHIDCLLKPLDEETILVKRLPEGHPDHDAIETIARDLSSRTGPYGRPYRIRRIDTPPYLFGFFVPNYTNSLILNRKILVPLYGIPADEKALATWREIMPGYEVIGFRNDSPYDWNWLDALHCRVRAVWDPGMLYMSHRRIDDSVGPAASYPVEVLIRDYSRAGLVPGELQVHWRLRGETDWRAVALADGSAPHLYVAAIPSPGPGRTVEYYFSAADASGRHETLPRVAPKGFYSFSVR